MQSRTRAASVSDSPKLILADLLRDLPEAVSLAPATLPIAGLSVDSRTLSPGELFVAIPGHRQNGLQFVAEAVGRKAAGVVSEQARPVKYRDVPWIQVPQVRLVLAHWAAQMHQYPSQHLSLVGITGTNGKTTVTYLLESIIKAAGLVPGVIGSINYRHKGQILPSTNTTPGALSLQTLLGQMKRDRVNTVMMEVSSHGIDQDRVACCDFDVCCLTNVTRDHLDYHKSEAQYQATKARLFEKILVASHKKEKTAVLPDFDPASRPIQAKLGSTLRCLTYGFDSHSAVFAKTFDITREGLKATVQTPQGSFHFYSPLVGLYNLKNCLAAIACAVALGLDLKVITAGLKTMKAVPGRLEKIGVYQGRTVFIDYAHTPDALMQTLEILRPLTTKHLTLVFGAGGDRDQGKRPLMGAIASAKADRVIVTSDNPRHEEPSKIINDILAGITNPHKKILAILDRAKAIRKALSLSEEGDTILLAGKGPEEFQIVGDQKLPFSERALVENYFGGSA